MVLRVNRKIKNEKHDSFGAWGEQAKVLAVVLNAIGDGKVIYGEKPLCDVKARRGCPQVITHDLWFSYERDQGLDPLVDGCSITRAPRAFEMLAGEIPKAVAERTL